LVIPVGSCASIFFARGGQSMDILAKLMKDPIFVMTLPVLVGVLIGQIKVGRFSLETSGALFAGLVMGALGYSAPKGFFNFNLTLFVVAVGLLSAGDMVNVIKRYGFKFAFLGAFITFVGAFITYLLAIFFRGSASAHLIGGTYTGALTSSPGLAAALEVTKNNPEVTVGHSIAYPFGVLAVILFVQFAPILFGIDVDKEREQFKVDLEKMRGASKESQGKASAAFSIAAFAFCIVVGYLLGSIKVPLGGKLSVSLGTTGGGLIAALILGSIGKVGPLNMRMDGKSLGAIRTIGLAYFLAIVGLEAGGEVIKTVKEHGFLLIAIGLLSAFGAEIAGYLVARYAWKMNWILLAGAICGGMTSTPGLGAAIDATKTEDVAVGYGATYPVALLGMVVFTSLLHILLG